MSIGYAKSQYGLTQRVFTTPLTKTDAGTEGTPTETYFVVPKKSKLLKFGIMSAASKVVCSTTTSFTLRRRSTAAELVTFTPGDTSISTGVATGVAPTTATNLVANVPYVPKVNTDVASSGSVYFFIDIAEKFTTTI